MISTDKMNKLASDGDIYFYGISKVLLSSRLGTIKTIQMILYQT
jgi:hypothetical protein